jgi:uncharacterized protein (TIGR02300 family)
MTLTTAKSDKGLKRICGGCSARFYDFNKTPIICPKCGEEFTGAVKIKSRRSRKSAEDVVAPVKEKAAKVKDQATEAVNDLENDEEEIDTDLDLDELANIDDEDSDDFEEGDDLDLSRVTSDS